MDLFIIISTALALSMDAFAVSVSTGVSVKNIKLKNALKVGAFFGVFQGLMPIIGYLAASLVSDYIKALDHWIAFILLAFIGIKMIVEAIKDDSDNTNPKNPLSNKLLLTLAVATSIDALAVGIQFAFFDTNIWFNATVICAITFVLSTIGVMFGKKVGQMFKKNAEIMGGIVLIAIGTKILLEHLEILG